MNRKQGSPEKCFVWLIIVTPIGLFPEMGRARAKVKSRARMAGKRKRKG